MSTCGAGGGGGGTMVGADWSEEPSLGLTTVEVLAAAAELYVPEPDDLERIDGSDVTTVGLVAIG